jgi:hypothetical protein
VTESAHQRVMRVLAEVLASQQWGRVDEIFQPDAIMEYPQSRELFRGVTNIRAQFENYPDLEPGTSELAEVIGGTTYAMTPSYTVIAVKGSGDQASAIVRVQYPDGSWWWVVNLYELRDARVSRMRVYFAPDFDAPDWRAPYRETP